MFLDPVWFIVVGPALILVLLAQHKVSSTYGKYSKVANMRGITGLEAAKLLLQANGLDRVSIEEVPGRLTDHYDPRSKVLRLSQGVRANASVASLGIVAHEVGHAVQDHRGYLPLRLRSGLVPMANLGSTLAFVLFILGLLIRQVGLLWLGVVFFSAAVLFALVTLPVELNASRRARGMLQANGLLGLAEMDATRAVLSAAALTYVAALLQSVSQLLYFVLYAVGLGRDE
jgi:hypothetical protein